MRRANSAIKAASTCLFFLAIAATVPTEPRAGAWVSPRRAQVKLAFLSHSTDEAFILTPRIVGSTTYEAGEKRPYPFDGKSISQAIILELRYGVSSRSEVAVRFARYDLQYNDSGGDRRNTGMGDLYAETVFQLVKNPLAATARVGVKAPTGEFDIDPERVPLSENQWDVEGAFALGRSFYPLPAYASADIGYRYRFENTQTRIKPGNEVFFSAETGVFPIRQLFLKILLEGLYASQRESREFGFVVKNADGRKLMSVSPYVTVYPVRHAAIEAGAKFLVAGRDYPAGVQYFVALQWWAGR